MLDADGSRALFRIVVERLGDLFEPRLCSVYAELFSEVIARRIPGLHAEHLAARYERIRRATRIRSRSRRDPERVRALARDLGRRCRHHQHIAGCGQAALPQRAHLVRRTTKELGIVSRPIRALSHLAIAYGRSGALDDRLSIWPELRDAVSRPASIVIDPDSRLTQLGLLPICPEEDYYFFESRSYGGASDEPLTCAGPALGV